MKVILPRQSLEFVSFPISTAPVDPASLTHEVAITEIDEQPSVWETVTFADGLVQVLIRASTEAAAGGDFTLDVGRWRLWWRASSNPEFPVRPVGVVTVV